MQDGGRMLSIHFIEHFSDAKIGFIIENHKFFGIFFKFVYAI